MVSESELFQGGGVIEQSDNEFSPPFREKPNYLLTRQIVGDIKLFIKIMLSMVLSYYEPVIKRFEFEAMKEDIIETITNIILANDVYRITFSFFRLEFTKLEKNLKDRYEEFKNISPGQCRVNEYFRLDKTSPLIQIYKDIVKKNMKSLFSEPMSINFDAPVRCSTSWNTSKSRSMAGEEFKMEFVDEEESKGNFFDEYIERNSKVTNRMELKR